MVTIKLEMKRGYGGISIQKSARRKQGLTEEKTRV